MSKLKNIMELAATLFRGRPSDNFIEFLHSPIVDVVIKVTPNPVDDRIVELLRLIFPKPVKEES